MGTGRIFHWELGNGEAEIVFDTDWAVVANETVLQVELAERGAGICYCLEGRVSSQLAAGTLIEVLADWSSMGPGFHLYYPSRRQLPEALRALVRMMQHSGG